MRKRTLARECVLKILYSVDITKESIDRCVDNFWNSQDTPEISVRKFADAVVNGVEHNKRSIDNIISKHATNWDIKRMAVIDRNILRIGVYELLFTKDTPRKVIINEAIDIAKKYGDTDSGKFVNGILDKISRGDDDKS